MSTKHTGEAVNLDDTRRAGAYLAYTITKDHVASRAVIAEAAEAGRLDQLLRGFTITVFEAAGDTLRTTRVLGYAREVARLAVLSSEATNTTTDEGTDQ